ncbi:MAG: diacylglycerol kinase family lipid kinase [Lachnospiraceae bacterium]|nr:diacylglycerol kinase family lipid kinase [Lachnospiraceae bacterium]
MTSAREKTYYIIVNPASHAGKSRQIWGTLSAALKERGLSYKTYLSAEPGDVTVLVRKIIRHYGQSAEHPAHIILLGGDGTLNELVNGITDFSRVIVSYIPTGSSNDFARAHKYSTDPVKELTRILSSRPTLLDVGETEFVDTDGIGRKKRFLISSGMGFDAMVCDKVNHSRAKVLLNKVGLGQFVYLVIALKCLFFGKYPDCTLTLEDGQSFPLKKMMFSAAMMCPYEGGGFKFAPKALPDDGLLDVCTVSNLPRLFVLCALPTALPGWHVILPGIRLHRTKSVRIRSSAPQYIHTDGETGYFTSDVTIRCLKGQLWYQ